MHVYTVFDINPASLGSSSATQTWQPICKTVLKKIRLTLYTLISQQLQVTRYQYFNMDSARPWVRHGCDVTSTTWIFDEHTAHTGNMLLFDEHTVLWQSILQIFDEHKHTHATCCLLCIFLALLYSRNFVYTVEIFLVTWAVIYAENCYNQLCSLILL